MGTTQHTSVCGTHPSEQQADRLQPRGRYTLAADAENDRFVTLLYTRDLYLASSMKTGMIGVLTHSRSGSFWEKAPTVASERLI